MIYEYTLFKIRLVVDGNEFLSLLVRVTSILLPAWSASA